MALASPCPQAAARPALTAATDPLNPIVLSIKRGRFRRDDLEAESADAGFGETKLAVQIRDAKTCHFCGFQADKWQDIHHGNDDHHDNRRENLITVCKICHACHHIGLAGMNNGGSIIYLPEISQVELNRLVRAMYVIGKVGSPEWRKRAGNLWQFLLSRQQPVTNALGSHDPIVLANALGSASKIDFDSRATPLAHLRFFIKPKSLMLALPKGGTVIDYWVSGVYNKVPEESWMALAEQVFDKFD